MTASNGAVTLKHVAERAGVSMMTVSNVLNERGKVGEKTKQQVLRAAKNLGYVPNASARRLASGIDARIALMWFAHRSPLLGEAINAAVHAGAIRGVQIMLEEIGGEPSSALRKMATRGTSAVMVLAPHSASSQFLQGVRKQGITPIAIAPGGRPVPNYSSVWVDDRAAAYDATKLLIDLGHRDIAFIRGPDDHPSSAERYEGYRHALRDASIPIRDDSIAEGQFDFLSGRSAAERFLGRKSPPTAVFASNDDMAAGVLAAAYRYHRQVPEQLSVVGFDDSILATRLAPQLTTVRQPVMQMLQAAVDIALEVARKGQDAPVVQRQMSYEIIQRDSTAAPQGRTSRKVKR